MMIQEQLLDELRYPFRRRNVAQLKSYTVDQWKYKQALKVNPDAIVKFDEDGDRKTSWKERKNSRKARARKQGLYKIKRGVFLYAQHPYRESPYYLKKQTKLEFILFLVILVLSRLSTISIMIFA